MKYRASLWLTRTVTVLGLAGWTFVLYYVDPQKGGAPAKLMFYLGSSIFLAGIFTLFLFWTRRSSINKEEDGDKIFKVSLRQGVLLSFLAITLLFMQSIRVLVWWDGMLITAGVFLIELYFLSHKK